MRARSLPHQIHVFLAHRGLLVAIGGLAFAMLWSGSAGHGAGWEALADDQRPADVRLGPLKDLNGYFPFVVPETLFEWEERAAALRRQVQVAQGLWPLPTKTPLDPLVHGLIEFDDYTIEKVYFESMPGFFVTGNLYRPRGAEKPHPGILCPHGHWSEGRFYDCGPDELDKAIEQGAEQFADGGRSPLQSRCVHLARMGCTVFHYDMIGYADSQQISREIIHGFRKQRPEMNRPNKWGLYSPQAESRLQSSMGLQTYNSIRALDFLLSLPEVDSGRVAVTGASGGGTQTFLLAALDPRVQVAFPAVMVSTAMQGGCTCENACCLRVGTGNIELAALFAPNPLAMTAADDWTVEMPTKGYPELQQLYQLYGYPQRIELTALPQFGHNFNHVSRSAMYAWLHQHLDLAGEAPPEERAYERLTAEKLSVWGEQHPEPPGGPDFERRLLAWWESDSTAQLDGLKPRDAQSCRTYQQVIETGIRGIIGRPIPEPSDLSWVVTSQASHANYRRLSGLLTYRLPPRAAVAASPAGETEFVQEQLPMVILRPHNPSSRVCLMAFPNGKAGMLSAPGELREPIRRLVTAGITVCAADLLYQGEFLREGETKETTRRVNNEREAAAYTFGYNPTLFGHRARDLLSLIAFFAEEPHRAEHLDLVGVGTAGPVAAVAAVQAGPRIARLAVDHADFRFAQVSRIHSPMFLPGGAKYHDLPGILATSAPRPLCLVTNRDRFPTPLAAAYKARGATAALYSLNAAANHRLKGIVDWLLTRETR